MVSFTSLVLGAMAATGALAFPFNATELFAREEGMEIGPRQSCYVSNWNAGGGSVNYQSGSGCAYSVSWSNCNNFVIGKGWNPGSNSRTITYSGSFQTSGNAYLSVYGWTTNPLVEYYVLEDFGDYNPGQQAQNLGTFTSDGSTYTIYTDTRNNAPSIEGTSTFNQYWSIRSDKRSSGTVTFANHAAAWAAKGLNLGTPNYQILATEGYQSSGSSSITSLSG